MTWVRLDEAFPEHPKVLAAGEEAAWLFVSALGYCNRNLTDGVVPTGALRRLTGNKSPQRLAAKLVDVGLFESHDEGYLVHDFLDYQPSKASIESERASARERMANVRQRSKGVRPNVQANEQRTSDNPSPSRPDTESLSRQSSTRSSNGTTHRPDDDDLFMKTINILVEHKAREHPPRSRRAWERTTIPKTIEEDGPQVRAHLEAQCDPITAAGLILGSRGAAELAAGRL